MSILILITGTRAEKETETSENTDTNDALITLLKAVDALKEDRWSKIDEAYDFPLLNNKKYIEELALAVVEHRDVLLIGGPKDSRNTTGLIYVAHAAKMVGYHELR